MSQSIFDSLRADAETFGSLPRASQPVANKERWKVRRP